MGAEYKVSPKVPEQQEHALLDQANPVQNTWYPLLHELNCIIYGAAVHILVANETLEMQATVDGVAFGPQGRAATFGAHYWAYKYLDPNNLIVDIGLSPTDPEGRQHAYFLQGRDVLIEVRKTTAAGIGNLRAIACWGQI